MNTISLHRTKDPNTKPPSDGAEESIAPVHQEINTAEGSEFLDDAIRMDDEAFQESHIKEEEE